MRILILIAALSSAACSDFSLEPEQFTKKLEAPAFVSELYGSSTQTLAVSHSADSHIAWLGFVQSQEFEYFKITKVAVGSSTIVADGQELNGEVFTASSNAVVEDISVSASSSTGSGYTDGSISVGGSSDLKVTVEYSPLKAIESESEPHVAYLLVNYDTPQIGTLRIKVTGFTQGIKAEKCTQDPSTMELIEYKVSGGTFDLYFCSAEVAVTGQNNTTQDTSDPAYHGASTNLVDISYPDSFAFYQVDEETVCLLSEADTISISGFTLPIPEGLAPIESMDIAMVDGSFAECTLDADKNIFCAANILIDALVSLTGFTLNNVGFTAEELVTDDCPDFGAISGAGKFGDAEGLHMILMGKTLSDTNTEEYNIVDSLIIADIPLEQ